MSFFLLKNIKVALFTTLIFILIQNVLAQQLPDTYYEYRSGKLDYGIFIPADYNPSLKYPVIMYLHGYGNNYSVYLNWYNEGVQNSYPCFVYTPKTPPSWGDWSGWWDQLTEPMTAAIHVLDSLIQIYSIDTNRIYVYGISMGGEGTFDLLDKFPHKFAAAMSVCGGGQSFWAQNISNTPFWMFHGSADNINPPEITERVYEALVDLGATQMRYTNYPGYGHEIWYRAESEPAWNDWMFSFSKTDSAWAKPDEPITLTGSISKNGTGILSWNDIKINDENNKIWYYKIYKNSTLLGTSEFDKTQFEIPSELLPDTYTVSAVNYHFIESEISNSFVLQKDSGEVSVKNSKGKIVNCNLIDAYPNPFNLETTIRYQLNISTQVCIKIYDTNGKKIVELLNEYKIPGKYSVKWNADKYSSGLYFITLETDGSTSSQKIVLLK